MRALVAALIVGLPMPARAEVHVPLACQELAKSRGYPGDPVISDAVAAIARARLAFESNRDPKVRRCRAAIRERERR